MAPKNHRRGPDCESSILMTAIGVCRQHVIECRKVSSWQLSLLYAHRDDTHIPIYISDRYTLCMQVVTTVHDAYSRVCSFSHPEAIYCRHNPMRFRGRRETTAIVFHELQSRDVIWLGWRQWLAVGRWGRRRRRRQEPWVRQSVSQTTNETSRVRCSTEPAGRWPRRMRSTRWENGRRLCRCLKRTIVSRTTWRRRPTAANATDADWLWQNTSLLCLVTINRQ